MLYFLEFSNFIKKTFYPSLFIWIEWFWYCNTVPDPQFVLKAAQTLSNNCCSFQVMVGVGRYFYSQSWSFEKAQQILKIWILLPQACNALCRSTFYTLIDPFPSKYNYFTNRYWKKWFILRMKVPPIWMLQMQYQNLNVNINSANECRDCFDPMIC